MIIGNLRSNNLNARKKGKEGEKIVTDYLEREKYTILATNYNIQMGEIDIIATRGDTVVFTEVKAWAAYGFENLQYSVNRKKQRKIVHVSKEYLWRHRELTGKVIRYDVAFVDGRSGKIFYIENAFTGDVS